MRTLGWVVAAAALAAADRPTPTVGPGLAGLAFLVGTWEARERKVAETGGTSRGRSVFTIEAGGNVLLRRDHTNLFSPGGKPTGGFDQLMMIYPEAGAIRADYSDGTHVVHYTSAEVTPGRAVLFASAARTGAPTFHLRYALTDPETLAVAFAMAPPGGDDFRPIATGTLKRTD